MESKVNYTIVGIFVLLLTGLGIIGGIWLSVGVNTTKYNRYLVLMDEPVSGLSVNAPVKYNGVDVGYVRRININNAKPEQVRLVIDIKKRAPVSADTRATLDMQGLTGIAYLELTGGNAHSKVLEKTDDEPYPVIRSAPSLMFRLDEALDTLTTNLQSITGSIATIFNSATGQLVTQTLQNFEQISATLATNKHQINHIINNSDVMLRNAAKASVDLPQLLQQISKATATFGQTAEQAKLTLRNSDIAVQNFNGQMLPQALQSLQQLQQVLANVNQIAIEVERNPAALVRGSDYRSDPGERR
jgi:phospholipid/cholesterol/gamma-HCH transport system substrate-binding protein